MPQGDETPKKTSSKAPLLLAALLAGGLAPIAHREAAQPTSRNDYVSKVAANTARPAGQPEKAGKDGWWATSWSKSDGEGFMGQPELAPSVTKNQDAVLIVRYTHYSTKYDSGFKAPIWGAYTLNKLSVQNDVSAARTARNPDFARPSEFFQEPLVVALSKRLGFRAASHTTFTDSMDPRFRPMSATGDPRNIQRGHMVPNNAMKCSGDYEAGQVAQLESFSVANIVPQMARSNAPTWANLESACFDWANELGQVWLFVGPVFNRRSNPTLLEKRKTGENEIVPCPDALYYVVIGKRGGKTAAVGFLIPHSPDEIDFKAKAVTVAAIEQLTGINFMPELKDSLPVESTLDPAWLQTPPRKKLSFDD